MNFQLSSSQWDAISRLLESTKDLSYNYPWSNLEGLTESGRINDLHLIGYGSLLNPDSARQTIRDTPANGHLPVIAFGAKRIFNYRMPQKVIQRYGINADPLQRAALNAEYTGNHRDLVNGRLLTVDPLDFDGLRERERGYDLSPVAYMPWHDLNSTPKIGFVLCANSASQYGAEFVDDSLFPYPPYLNVCREGAKAVSSDFEAMFLNSTLLGNRQSKLIDYI